jgi:transcription antitermination factor NusA-like protein
MYLFQELLINSRKTFELEIPEVFDGLVIVKGIAREAELNQSCS